MCILHALPLLLYVRNKNSTVDTEMICAGRLHLALLSERLELLSVTTQLVGNSPSPLCALLLALK